MPKGNKSSEEEEQPSTSTQSTPSQKKDVHKPVFSSPLKKGETADIWTWPKYKTQLPVTCGDKKATLYRDKLARGEDCLQAGDQWFTPAGFEEFGGKNRRKNWKTSIRCEGTTLEKLIQSKRELFPSNQSAVSSTDSEHEANDKEEAEQEWEEVVGCMFESDSIPESPDFPFYDSAEEEEAQKEQETGNRKRKMSKGNERDEEGEQPSTSTQSTPIKMKKVQKPVFCSPLKKGETADIWTWPKYKTQLQVTCGDKKATLYRDKLARGEDCLQAGDQWFTPAGFEEFGGKKSFKNWKTSIRCEGTTLKKLFQEGYLTSPIFKRRKPEQSKRELFPSNQSAVSSTDSIPGSPDFPFYDSAEEEEAQKEQETGNRKRKMSKGNERDEEGEQPSTSTQSTPIKMKKVQKPVFCSPLKKGETADIWTWPSYKTQLPVTCGDKKATLYRDKLARGREDCILVDDQWFTPTGFEVFGGKKSSKNWKTSIRCEGITLAKLIQGGHLISPSFKRRKVGKIKTELFPSNKSAVSSTDSEYESDQEEDDEEVEVENEKEEGERGEQSTSAGGGASPGGSQVVGLRKTVFQVTCGVLSGMLHKDRFASGTRGKSIRTERSWMTPMEFLRGGSVMADTTWKKDILCDGNPLSVLIENEVLIIHSVLCECNLCDPNAEDLQEQVNDDDCFICRLQGSLICCDECPRSFHQGCHLPNVDDALLGNDRPWECTFCILRNSRSWRQPSKKTYQEVLNYRTSDRLLECQYLLLCLYHTDEDQIFVKNPCIKVRNYSSVIETPMWLDEVAAKLQNSQYQTVKAFVADVLLIFTNCAAFNRDNAETLKNNAETLKDIAKTLMDNAETAERLKDVFKGEFKKAFSL
ncbi:uncharacterized protein LOC105010094 isoform X3 [Esox lucius]|uniref:uncharacterized protein LOC105010094 isoform X3 n=1 Tax=Esox lucius TaxID=8010 RepID=UPI0014775456|nr:uncharacterized protein LOC105010094 isoform X3 [Esox lucius]